MLSNNGEGACRSHSRASFRRWCALPLFSRKWEPGKKVATPPCNAATPHNSLPVLYNRIGKMQNRSPITKQGADKLRAELQRLKNDERPRVTAAIATAREHGDLKENAEYHAARERQSMIEGRIKEIDAYLSDCQVIDVASLQPDGKIVFGATVVLYDEERDARMTCRIVGEPEADIKENLISITSPIARALIGKSAGDVAVVNAPGGEKTYEIESISY